MGSPRRPPAQLKPLKFIGTSLDDLRAMPASARHTIGVELMRLQLGADPLDFKPMPTVGSGAYEVRVREASGAYRVIYVAKFADAIYVLHAFQKKSPKGIATDRRDVELIARRLKAAQDDYRRHYGTEGE
jgi:phage-related protein